MPPTVHVNPAWLAGFVIATLFVLAYPLVLAILANQKLKVGWRYFWWGVLIFTIFQLATRIPAVLVLQSTVLAPLLRTSKTFLWTWLVILALTAGLFEEVGRYVGYRLFMRREEKTWNKAVMYGIGHGGVEAVLLVGLPALFSIVNLIFYSLVNLNNLPPATHALVVKQMSQINAQPVWTSLLGGWERLWTMPIHIGQSVIVLQVFRRHNISWLFLAIGLHTLLDFCVVAFPQIFGASATTSLMVEGVVLLFGLLGIWLIWRLRDRETPREMLSATETVVPET